MGNDDAKKLILARRARFMAAALAGVAGAGTLGVQACGGETDTSSLATNQSAPEDGGKDGAREGDGGVPQPCLSPRAPVDAGASPDASADGGAPRPCLGTPRPELDAGKKLDGGLPVPCLSLPIDAG